MSRERLVLHRHDLLVEVDGGMSLLSVEHHLAAAGGLTLHVALEGSAESSVADWLARGAPGARSALADPADHLVAGLEGTLPDGRAIVVRPEPRRAVGPDLVALAMGTAGRFVRVTRAWLRVHAVDAPRPTLPLPEVDLDPPLEEGERGLLEAIARELGAR